MARAIISMSETLHLGTIAEGIESSEQIVMLQGLGCEMGQGYHFAKPLNVLEMSNFLRDETESTVAPVENSDQEDPVVAQPIPVATEAAYQF